MLDIFYNFYIFYSGTGTLGPTSPAHDYPGQIQRRTMPALVSLEYRQGAMKTILAQ